MTGYRADGLLKPCGTPAAYRRHLRRGELPCTACRGADGRRKGSGRGAGALPAADDGPARNGLPIVPYAYQARTYPWAQRALASAEAAYGTPDDAPDWDEAPLLDALLATGYARRAVA
jgi:hypothetical protein